MVIHTCNLTFERMRQEDCGFPTSLRYMASSMNYIVRLFVSGEKKRKGRDIFVIRIVRGPIPPI
jgi:hypothetical protein